MPAQSRIELNLIVAELSHSMEEHWLRTLLITVVPCPHAILELNPPAVRSTCPE